MPSAERVRFTSSGTEATLMAVRLARAFTGRRKIIRFKTHFHGWHDHMTSGYAGHFDGSPTPGVLAEVAANALLLEPGDPDALRAALAADQDIAAALIEPTGGSFGMTPLPPGFLASLRELTLAHGVLLILDEVITGFRVAPGGAQAHFGITPDLTALAKILAGGLPGGAVVGRADVLERLDFARTAAAGREKIQHPGTFNANPVSAAAGIAALEVIATTDACARANAAGDALRAGFNQALEAADVPWAAYGTFSGLHLFTNAKRPQAPAVGLRPARGALRRAQGAPGRHHAPPAGRDAGAGRRPQQLAGRPDLGGAGRAGPRRHDRRLRRGAPPAQARGRPRPLTSATSPAAASSARSPAAPRTCATSPTTS